MQFMCLSSVLFHWVFLETTWLIIRHYNLANQIKSVATDLYRALTSLLQLGQIHLVMWRWWSVSGHWMAYEKNSLRKQWPERIFCHQDVTSSRKGSARRAGTRDQAGQGGGLSGEYCRREEAAWAVGQGNGTNKQKSRKCPLILGTDAVNACILPARASWQE